MKTIIIDERTKAGKILLELAKILAESNEGIVIENESNSKSKDIKKDTPTFDPDEFDLDESLGLK